MRSVLIAITTFFGSFFLTIFFPFQYSFQQLSVVFFLVGYPFDFAGFTLREIHHMYDVRLLIWLALLILVVLASLCFYFRKQFVKKDVYFSSALLFGIFSLFGLLFFLFPFRDLFIIFHEILFWNDLWLLPPGSQLLLLFPETFFFSMMVWIIANTLVISTVLTVTTKYKTQVYNYLMRKK